MASLLDALASGAKNRVASAAKDAKDGALNQFDPRKSIYGLGMGVGPLIRQTVAEYKKQQGKSSEKDIKKTAKDIVDIKTISSSSKNSLSKIDAQFRAMNNILGDIRKINMAQLQAMKVGANIKDMSFNKGNEFRPLSQDRDGLKNDNESSDKLSAVKKAALGAGLFAGAGIAYNNRGAIEQVVDDYLKGAGLPTKEELGKVVGDRTKELPGKVADLIGDTLVDGVMNLSRAMGAALVRRAKRDWDEATGNAKDKQGNPMPADSTRLGKDVGTVGGTILGTILGSKIPGMKWLGGALGGYAGNTLGEMNPEATMGGLGALAAGGLAWKFRGAKTVASTAAQAAPEVSAAASTGSPWLSNMFKKAPPPVTPEIGSAVKLTDYGTVGNQRQAHHIAMEKAAQQQASTLGKAQNMIGGALDKAGDLGKQAGEMIGKNSGKIFGALNVAMSLPGIWEDIENGDWKAAAITATGVAASIATTGLTGGLGFGAGIAIGVGSNYLADKYRTGGKKNITPSSSPAATTTTTDDQAHAPSATPSVTPSSSPAGTQSSDGSARSLLTMKFEDLTEDQKVALLEAQQRAEGWWAGTMSFRHNNPGNLKFADWERKYGAVPGEQASDGGVFARFPSLAAGRMAQRALWEGSAYRNLSIAAGLQKWHTTKDTTAAENYASKIAQAIGVQSGNISIASQYAEATSGVKTPGVSGGSATGADVSKLKSMGLADDQIATLTGFQETIKGFNDLSNIFTGNFDNVPGTVAPNPSSAAPSGGNSNKTPPTVPPVSQYKEKHSFMGAQLNRPNYITY